jgi:hypothetical protein
VRLEFSPGQPHDLRDAAAEAGVSVDAWLGVMIEYTAALKILERALGSRDQARQRLSHALADRPVMVAALPGWRRWQGYLGRRAVGRPDELPEVVLPERLIARGNGDVDVAGALSAAADWPLARDCEIAACGSGRTLEAFMLQAVLA